MAALVTAGLVSAYQGVVLNVRAGSVQTTFIGAVANVRRAFASATTFAGGRASMNAIIYSSAPDNFRNTNGSARDAGITFPWWEGSSKLIASATAAEHSADLFTLHLENVPPAVCEAVGAAFIGNSSVEQIAADKAAAIGGAGEVADTGVDLAANCANVDSDDDLTDLKIQFRG
ncbi:type 4 pilus major pilin [Ruegeria sp.]|uniref:type 4 pilus major pilin n=1 Tax=Ruegeria sp. TaxID=1879320 RepID=UPI003AFFD14D